MALIMLVLYVMKRDGLSRSCGAGIKLQLERGRVGIAGRYPRIRRLQ